VVQRDSERVGNAGKKDEKLVVSRWLGGLLNAGTESESTEYREDPGKS
jgi:hypothetical protein